MTVDTGMATAGDSLIDLSAAGPVFRFFTFIIAKLRAKKRRKFAKWGEHPIAQWSQQMIA